MHDTEVVGTNAYCAFVNGLVILDVANPAAPAFRSRTFLQGQGESAIISDGFAYLADGLGGLCIIDITDADHPNILGSYDTPGYAFDIALSGHYAYVADGDSGLQIIDIENPASPAPVGHFAHMGECTHVIVRDGFAYLTCFNSIIVDISNPANPFLVASIDIPSTIELDINGQYLYAIANRPSFNELKIVDISAPTAPVILGQIALYHRDFRDIEVSGNYAYVVNGPGNLDIFVFDISDPGQPFLHSSHFIPQVWDPASICLRDSIAYIADSEIGLVNLNIDIPDSITFLGLYSAGSDVRSIAISEHTVITAHDGIGTATVDFSDPSQPQVVGHFNTAWTVASSGSTAFTGLIDEFYYLEITDISNPAQPWRQERCTTIGFPQEIVVQGNYVYLAGGGSGLEIYNVSNPYQAFLAAYFPFEPSAWNVELTVSGNLAFMIPQNSQSVIVFDVSDPSNPTTVSIFTSENTYFYDSNARGEYLYLTASGGKMLIVDTSDPAFPVLDGQHIGNVGRSVTVTDDYAFVAANFGPAVGYGMMAIDISDPGNPFEACRYLLPHYPSQIAISDNLVIAASVYSLTILGFRTTGITDPGQHSEMTSLGHAYPNPFNASTTISYSLPSTGLVTVEIYNVLGQRVARLWEGNQAAGPHSIQWHAGDCPSGVYFYRLKTDSFSDSRIMTLLK
jgi:hypothetical protein